MKLMKLLPLAAAVLLLSMDPLSAGKESKSSFRIRKDTAFESVVGKTRQQMYLLSDSVILADQGSVANPVATQKAGSTVSVIEMDGSMCKVLTTTGAVGYIELNKLTERCEYVFSNADTVKYADEGTVLRAMPFPTSSEVMQLELNDEIHITGNNDFIYQECEVDGVTYYVDRESLMDEMYVEPEPEEPARPSYEELVANGPVNYTWNGAVLNPVIGTVMGPNGKETYYNLPMGGVIDIMRGIGYNGEYWVRSDGVKMLGDYIMVACDLSIRPRGSLIETSLGMAIVCDTGSFIHTNPYQIDIAVAW